MRFPFRHGAERLGRRLAVDLRLVPLAVLLFLVALVIGFATGFPTEVLRERLVREISSQTGLAASSESLALGFPAKVVFDLTLDTNQAQLEPLVFTQIEVRPVWTSLFSGAKAATLQAKLAGGDIDAQIGTDEHLKLEIEKIRLGPLQKTENPYRCDGVLRGQLDGQQIVQAGNADALFSAEISGLEVLGLEAFSLSERLALGVLSLQGQLKGQRLNLEKVVLDGDFAGLTGDGTIQLGVTPRQTRLNLRMALTPGQAFPESLKPLLELSGIKPKPDGSYQFRIAGTLAQPVLR